MSALPRLTVAVSTSHCNRGRTSIVKTARERKDVTAAHELVGTYRGAAEVCGTTHKSVKPIGGVLWEDYQAFITRDLSDLEIEYLFVDAVFESLPRHGAKEPCWWAGRSPPTAANTCCTWPSEQGVRGDRASPTHTF